MAEQHTLYKLIVLYMLRKIDFSMTFSQISDFVLEKGYTTYFTLQVSLSELVEANLVHTEMIRNITYYTITPAGESTIDFFENKINASLRKDITDYLRENKMQMRDEVCTPSDYYLNSAGEYEVHCQVKEGHSSLIDLKLCVPEISQARAISENWKEKSQAVYEFIMKELLR